MCIHCIPRIILSIKRTKYKNSLYAKPDITCLFIFQKKLFIYFIRNYSWLPVFFSQTMQEKRTGDKTNSIENIKLNIGVTFRNFYKTRK